MSDDVLITPGSRKIEFKDSSANVDAKIETDSSGNLIITNTGGDITIGDTTSDIFVGDGTANVDIVFEQAGEIRGTTGVTVTLGAADSNIRMATDLNLNSNNITNVNDLTVTGNLTITGDINSYNVTDLDVTDKTITLGVGQTEANSGSSGIIIDGSAASMLWDEGDNRWEFNKNIYAPVIYGSGAGITSLNGSNISSGTVAADRIASLAASKITSGTFADARISSSSVTQHLGSYLTGNQTITLSGDVSGSGTTSIAVTIADDSHNHIISNVDGLQTALDGKLSTTGTAANSQLLDSLDSTAFLRSNAADTATGQIFFDAGFDSHPIMLSGAQNFDNIDRSGFYNLYNTHNGSTNSPGFSYGTMIAIGNDKGSTGFGLQIAHERTGTGMYVRGMNDTASAWSAWAEIWTSTTDGSGSGLDADKLDNQEGSYYLNYNNFTNTPTIPTNNNQLTNGAGYTTNTGTVSSLSDLSITSTAAELNVLDGYTGSVTELNYLDTLHATGVTSTEFDYLDGVTSNIQTQLNGKQASGSYLTGNQTITLSGDVSGSGTTSISVTVADDSHNHVISNVDGLQTALDGKLSTSGTAANSQLLDSLDSSQFLRSDATDTASGAITFSSDMFAKNVVFVGGSSYNENIRCHPSSGNDYSSLVLGAVSGNSGTGTGQWTLVRYPAATHSNKFSIRHNSSDLMTILTNGNIYHGSSNLIWHAGNDGANSGLDADLLDAQHGSYYLDYNNFTNTPTIPSLSGYATESYVNTQVSNLVDSAPSTLDTLNELAAALGDDANFSTTVTNSIATKAPIASPSFTTKITTPSIHNSAKINILNGTSAQGIRVLSLYAGTTYASDGSASGTVDTLNGYRVQGAEVINSSGNWVGGGNISEFTNNSGYLTSSSGLNASNLTSGTIPSDRIATGTSGDWWAGNPVKVGTDGVMEIGKYIDFHNTDTGTSDFDTRLFSNANGQLTINGAGRIFADDYHPNADTWTTARTITLGGDLTGNVSINGSANVTLTAAVVDDSHNHVISNIDNLQSTLDGKTSLDHFRSLGSPAFTGGSNPNITTAQYVSEMEGDGAFDSFTSAFKTTWSYAGNYNLSDAGSFGPTETAGMAHLTWTDNSSDTTRGNITVLAIAPTTGGSAGGVYVYNDQGSSYAPGWREIWTSSTDGPGSGLDADLLDGQHGSYYAPASTALTTSTSFGGDVSGTYNAIVVADDSHNHVISNVDGLQTALDARPATYTGTYSGTYNIPIYSAGYYPNPSAGGVTITGSTGQISTPSHGNSSQWNTAYGWGNHASAGYITSSGNTSGTAGGLSGTPNITVGTINSGAVEMNAGTTVNRFHCTQGSVDDWQRSPISIRERSLNGNASTSSTYAPNLNFHWGSIVSRSLTMLSDGSFVLGEWSSTGTPSTTSSLSTLNTGAYQINGTTVIDSSRNLTNIGTISSGAITSTGNSIFTGSGSSGSSNAFLIRRGSDNSGAFRVQNDGVIVTEANYLYAASSGISLYVQNGLVARGNISNDTSGQPVTVADDFNVTGVYQLNGSTIIQQSGSYLRINQSNEYSNGIWTGSSYIQNGTGAGIACGSNGTFSTARVRISGGTYDGTSVIHLNGTDGSISGTTLNINGQQVINSSRQMLNLSTITSGVHTINSSAASHYLDMKVSGITRGRIGNTDTTTSNVYLSNSAGSTSGTGIKLTTYTNVNNVSPCYGDGTLTNNLTDLGTTSTRWKNIYAGSNIYAGADVVAYSSSDERLKDNLERIQQPIEKIQKISGYEFDWNDNQDTFEGHDIGVVAQEVEKVLPEIVETRENGYKAVKYEKMVALLIEGIKEQQEQIKDLQQEIKNLKENKNGNN